MGIIAPVGRALFSALFIFAGFDQFRRFGELTALARSLNVPMPEVTTAVTSFIFLAGGICVLLGVLARVSATLLAILTLYAAVEVHPFWKHEGEEAVQKRVHFMKDMSIAGAGLLLAHLGPGAYSLRRNRSRNQGLKLGP